MDSFEYCEYYHDRPPHQGLGKSMISSLPQNPEGEIVLKRQLGSLLKLCRRVA